MADEQASGDGVRHHLLYWQMRSVEEHAASGAPLDVAASNQLSGVLPGDVIWIVTLSEEREFLLCGRLLIEDVVEYEEAVRRISDSSLWQAEHYAFPVPGTEEPFFFISFEGLADSLRFTNTDPDKFATENGTLNPAQLSQIRTLTDESAEMLSVIWQRIAGGAVAPEPDPQEAYEFFSAAAEAEPDDPVVRYNLGVTLSRLGRFDEAVEEYRASVKLDPAQFMSWYNLGCDLTALGRLEEAIEAFNSAIVANYDLAPAHFMLGTAYANSEDHRSAIEATLKGLEVDPEDPMAFYNIGVSRFELGEFRESVEALQSSISLDPEIANTYYLLGRSFRMLGDREGEIAAYKEAIERMPMHSDAMFALGAAYALECGDRPEIVEYIQTEGEFDLTDPDQGFYMGMASLALGDPKLPESQAAMLDEKDPVLAERLRRHIARHRS